MGDSDTATSVDISSYGKLSIAPDSHAPLLVVFGGINVLEDNSDTCDKGPDCFPSGVYMWHYMDGIKDKFHIFVAADNTVLGKPAYDSLIEKLKAKGLEPSRQVLYLFSGGWAPGKDVLRDAGAKKFSSIYLVDIWMRKPKSSDFYKGLADSDAAKLTYVYTESGAVNSGARDYLAKRVGPRATLVSKGKLEHGAMTHMRTNAVAIGTLK